MTLREVVNEELNKIEFEKSSKKKIEKTNEINDKYLYSIKINNEYINFNKIGTTGIVKINKKIILNSLSKEPIYLGKDSKLLKETLNYLKENKEETISIKINRNNYDNILNLVKELITKREKEVQDRISNCFKIEASGKIKKEENFNGFKIKIFDVSSNLKITINDRNILTDTRIKIAETTEEIIKYFIENGFQINAGDLGEKEVQFAPQQIANDKGISGEERENLEENINPDYFYSLVLAVGTTTSHDNEGNTTANSADNVYLFKNKKVLIETKNTFNKVVDDPWGKDIVPPSLQKDLYAIIRFLDPKLNTSIKGENNYTFGVFVNKFIENGDTRVFVDNSNKGYTKIKLDSHLKEKLNINNDFVTFKDYTNLIKGSSIKRILSLKQFEEQVINPSLKNIEKVITIKNIISKEQWNNLNNQKSVVTEGVFDNVKKGVTAAKMALALGTSKLDPNYKSSQNYQQNTKIERQYNQNQEIFKAAKKSLDSIINFCKKYRLNNSLQEANRLLPLLNKKMAASVETKYFNY